MAKPKVLMTNPSIPDVAWNILKKKCELIATVDDTRKSILEKAAGVDALFWNVKVKLDKEVLDIAGPQLKVIGTMSAGLDLIDLEEVAKRRIKLGNTPKLTNSAVANMAVLLALAASRRLNEGRISIEKGTWNLGVAQLMGVDIEDSTVGIVGLGEIGQTIAKRFKAFDIGKLLYTGRSEKVEAKQLRAEYVSFDTLLRESDFVIASVPMTKETNKMFNAEAFSKMKSTAVFINISRGGIVDQPALIEVLKNKTIFAAGLDVTTPEPLPKDNELVKLPNCVLAPHLGSALPKTRNQMAELTANNILNGLNGEPMLGKIL